jgi:hypothetical protein
MFSKLSVLTACASAAAAAGALSPPAPLTRDVVTETDTDTAGLSSNPAYVCSFCQLALGLVEESAFQLHLLPYLESKCTSDACKSALDHLVLSIEGKASPEETCRDVEMCTDECVAFTVWPVNPIPAKVCYIILVYIRYDII